MRIRIRIYTDKEPELYALYQSAGPSLTRKVFKQSVKSYCGGEPFNISLPKIKIHPSGAFTPNPMFDITIPDEFQSALQNLPDKGLSTFVKTLVRYYTFWDLTEIYQVPHTGLKPVTIPQKQEKPKKEHKIVPIQSKEVSVKNTQQAPEVPTDLSQIDNNAVNSLAALFGSISTK